jgi:integrase
VKTRYANVTVAPDRHGKLRAQYRKGGKTAYMKTLPDQPGFEGELTALREARKESDARNIPRSVNDLCARYYRSADFAKGGTDDRRRRRGLIESFRVDFGNDMVSDFEFEHIEAILIARTVKRRNDKGREVGGEVAAMNLRKQLRRLFAYGRKLKWIPGNPVEEADTVGKRRLTGYHSWTEDEITQYKRRHAVGTKARLALEIILWTGQRRGDARMFGPKHIINGKIHFRAAKNKADLGMPLAQDLRRAIAAMPSVGITTFLVTEYGKPFTKDGFGNKMREWCDQADLPQCSAHGLRHAIGRRMAESEASQQGMKAVGGWKNDSEVSTYSASASQERLADDALGRVITKFSERPDS